MAGSVAFEALQWIWTLLPYMALLTALEAPRRAWGALICPEPCASGFAPPDHHTVWHSPAIVGLPRQSSAAHVEITFETMAIGRGEGVES